MFASAKPIRSVSRHLARRLSVAAMLLALAAGLAVTSSARAALTEEAAKIRIKSSNVIDRLGDCHTTLEVKMPASMYTLTKTRNPNTAVLLRRLGVGRGYAELDNATARFDDDTSTVVIDYIHRGIARNVKDDLWEAPLASTAGELELVDTHDRTAIFEAAGATDLGVASMVLKVEIPEAAHDLGVRTSPHRLAYHLSAMATAAGEPGVDMQLEARSQIMSCLAKSYGNDHFNNLWVARAVLKNTGNETLKNYRIRFRLTDYTGWSSWRKSAAVQPGQTVVDPFFPVFDLDKLANIAGPRPVTLEMEYEYQQADGETVRQSDTRQVQLLGRNEVFFSNLDSDQTVNWMDQFENAPLILASFVTSDDPVMQQVAGGISRLAGGPAAALNADDALKFMKTLYDFMGQSGIAYQTPPGRTFEGQLGQHVKFGRDVLRMHAGTCIDLAIFYASVCESVGLRTEVFVIPGHAFPAIRLPDGRLIPVETTMEGHADFAAAMKRANETAVQAMHDGRFYKIDVRKLHDLGVHSLELAVVEPDYLAKLGYTFEPHAQRPANTMPVRTTNNDEQPVVPVNAAQRLLGKWGGVVTVNGRRMVLGAVFAADGTYSAQLGVQDAYGRMNWAKDGGRYTVQEGTIEFVPNCGNRSVRRFQFSGNQLQLELAEIGGWVSMSTMP